MLGYGQLWEAATELTWRGKRQNVDWSQSRTVGAISFLTSQSLTAWPEGQSSLWGGRYSWSRSHRQWGAEAIGWEARAEIQVDLDKLRRQPYLYIFGLSSHFFPLCSLSLLFPSCSSFSHPFLHTSCFFISTYNFALSSLSAQHENPFCSVFICPLTSSVPGTFFLFLWPLEWEGIFHYY